MKIHADKIENGPPHGLRVRDVRLILASVPPDWTDALTEARLANGLTPNGQHQLPQAFYSRNHGSLTIYSREGTKRQVLVAILSALAAPSLDISIGVSRSPSAAEEHRLGLFIQPLVEKILPELTPPKKLSLGTFVKWQPLPFPNDTA